MRDQDKREEERGASDDTNLAKISSKKLVFCIGCSIIAFWDVVFVIFEIKMGMMQIKLFSIMSSGNSEEQDELNIFLKSHKILQVEQNFNQNDSRWHFCIRYLLSAKVDGKSKVKKKIDYKNILSKDEFEIFSKLREIRKQIAMNEAIPAYAVFTDFEISEISKLKEISIQNLKTIKGIGEKKVSKYGAMIIDKMGTSNQKKEA